MNKFMSWLRKIDEFMFNQIDLFRDSKYYEQLMDFMNQLTDQQQKLTTYIISAVVILGPVLFLLVLAYNTYEIKKNLNIKKEIQTSTYKFINHNDRLQSIQQSILTPRAPDDQRELLTSFKSFNIDQTKLSVSNFKQESSDNSPQIKLISADVVYKKLPLSDFIELMKKLVMVNRVRISGIEVIRDNADKLLSGKVSTMQYTKK